MGTWIYVFAQFTREALLFQSLAIFFLVAIYAAFWVLKKRRLGAIESEVPAGVVKVYLNELIQDAESMRAQLFGLLRSAGVAMEPSAHGHSAPQVMNLGGSMDTALLQKISQLELRMTDQSRAMDGVVTEKMRLEQELAAARALVGGAGAPAPAGGADPLLLNQLQEKIALLEGRLAEYSVIEDDLANLKRLQQENAALKAALEGKGLPAPAQAPAAAPAPAVVTPAPVAEVVAPTLEAGPSLSPQPPAGAEAAPNFEGLVDQVEQSLQPAAAPLLETPVAELSTLAPSADTMEKSDADLVAEFEKMLKP